MVSHTPTSKYSTNNKPILKKTPKLTPKAKGKKYNTPASNHIDESSARRSSLLAGINSGRASEYDPERAELFGDEINIPASSIDYASLDKTSVGKELAGTLRQTADKESSRISISHGKYAGKRSSRSEDTASVANSAGTLDESDDVDEREDEQVDEGTEGVEGFGVEVDGDKLDDDEVDIDDDIDDDEVYAESGEDSDTFVGDSELEEGEDEIGEEEGEEGEGEEDGTHILESSNNNNTNNNNKTEIKKCYHTRNQLLLWDSIMALRIQLHPMISMATALPQKGQHTLFTQTSPLVESAFKSIITNLHTLLDNMCSLQEQFMENNIDPTYKLPKNRKRSREEMDAPSSCEAWWEIINPINTKLEEYVGNVVDKWSGRVQVSSGKVFSKSFQSLNQSFMQQITTLFNDRERLVKRSTRLRNHDAKVFGKQNQDEFDDEIYEDTDFYQILLKDLVSNGSIGAAGNTSEYWHEMSQVKKNKTTNATVKRPVGASKGKLIKYDVHDKLVNFMLPDDRPIICDWNLDDLFKNLFNEIGTNNPSAHQ